MIVLAVLVAFVTTLLVRRVPWVHDRLPPPAVATVLTCAAVIVVIVLSGWPDTVWRALIAIPATVVVGAAAILLAGWFREFVIDPLRRRAQSSARPPVRDRVTGRADALPWRVAGWSPIALAVRTGYRSGDVRVTGLAAEMSYYALISLVPLTTALGSSLGYLSAIVGEEQVDEIRDSIIDLLTTIFAEQVASDVLAPLVDGLLSAESAGLAVGALLITLYLASRMFRAAVRALDDAYGVPSRRGWLGQYALGFVFTVVALVAVVSVALLVVIGPLLGDGAELAAKLGFGEAFSVAWSVLRWPTALLVGFSFLMLLYRYAPNVQNTWRRSLPGAIGATAGVIGVSAGYRLYVDVVTPAGLEVDAGGTAVVQAAAQMLSVVLASVLWVWLVSIVVLLGGIVNAEIDAERRVPIQPVDPGRPADRTEPADPVSDAEPRRTP